MKRYITLDYAVAPPPPIVPRVASPGAYSIITPRTPRSLEAALADMLRRIEAGETLAAITADGRQSR